MYLRHRVLTTDQLAALAFGNITTTRHRLAVLVRHAREHGSGELLQWDGEGEASDYLYARQRELGLRPDGLGVWAQDGPTSRSCSNTTSSTCPSSPPRSTATPSTPATAPSSRCPS